MNDDSITLLSLFWFYTLICCVELVLSTESNKNVHDDDDDDIAACKLVGWFFTVVNACGS